MTKFTSCIKNNTKCVCERNLGWVYASARASLTTARKACLVSSEVASWREASHIAYMPLIVLDRAASAVPVAGTATPSALSDSAGSSSSASSGSDNAEKGAEREDGGLFQLRWFRSGRGASWGCAWVDNEGRGSEGGVGGLDCERIVTPRPCPAVEWGSMSSQASSSRPHASSCLCFWGAGEGTVESAEPWTVP